MQCSMGWLDAATVIRSSMISDHSPLNVGQTYDVYLFHREVPHILYVGDLDDYVQSMLLINELKQDKAINTPVSQHR
jgi:hypothetical protein